MRIGGLGLHVGQIDDGAVIGHKGRGQRQQGVLHPEALHAGLLEDEQHAFLGGHLPAVHQAGLALLRRLRHLGIDAVHAGRELDALQRQLWPVLGAGCGGPQRHHAHPQGGQRGGNGAGNVACGVAAGRECGCHGAKWSGGRQVNGSRGGRRPETETPANAGDFEATGAAIGGRPVPP